MQFYVGTLFSLNLLSSGAVEVESGPVVPGTDALEDLGSTSKRWGELYLAPASSGVGDTYICLKSDGQLRQGATCAASTRKIKENIQPIMNGLQAILALNPVTFNYLAGFYGGKQDIGFIAEEVAAVDYRFAHYSVRDDTLAALTDTLRIPGDSLLKGDTLRISKRVVKQSEPNAINYMAILAALVSAVKTQQAQIDSLRLLVKKP